MHTLLLSVILAASGDVNLWLKINKTEITGASLTALANAVTAQYPDATPATVREYTVARTINEAEGEDKPGQSNPLGANGCRSRGSYEVTNTIAQYWADQANGLMRKYISKTDTHVTYWRNAPTTACSEASRAAWNTFVSNAFAGIDFFDSVQIGCRRNDQGDPVICVGAYADQVNQATGILLKDSGNIVRFISGEP